MDTPLQAFAKTDPKKRNTTREVQLEAKVKALEARVVAIEAQLRNKP